MIKNSMIFIAGAAAGACGMWFYSKKHFEELNEADLLAEKEHYRQRIEELIDKYETCNTTKDISDEFDREEAKKLAKSNNEYKEAIAASTNYSDYFKGSENAEREMFRTSSIKEEEEDDDNDIPKEGPFTITPDDYVELNGFDKVTLTYYEEDGVFANIEDEIFDGGLNAIGKDNLEDFGIYEEGVLYVRNESMGCDYEVILEHGSYSDIVGE